MDEKYFIAKLYYEFPDEETGKIKKVKEYCRSYVTRRQLPTLTSVKMRSKTSII